MNTTTLLKKLSLILAVIALLVSVFPSAVLADGPTPGVDPLDLGSKTVPTDPNRPLTAAEKKFRDAKYRALKQFVQSNDVSGFGGIPAAMTLVVGTWKQPNTAAYVNHCGPAATQVALDARWDASRVYSINRIAKDEKTNSDKAGTHMQDIYTTINSKAYLGSEFPNPNGMAGYWIDLAKGGPDLLHKITFDITRGYALITGVKTTGMLGWGDRKVNHIVAVIGYKIDQTNTAYVVYTDTSTPTAGFNGNYRNTVLLSKFYKHVLGLNTLIW